MSLKLANDTANGSSTIQPSNTATGDVSHTLPAFTTELAPRMQLMTAQNSTSGTSIDFTGIPSWAKRITVMFNGVSTTGISLGVQLGSTAFTTTGYTGSFTTLANTSPVTAITPTNLIGVGQYADTSSFVGVCVITYISGNIWVGSSNGSWFPQNVTSQGSGSVTLSGVLDRIRITTVNGTDTFDAGQINVLYEG